MRNIILAVFLALISLAPTLHAQNTKAAPDFPGFRVTLAVKNGTGGTFKAFIGDTELPFSSTKDTCMLAPDKGPGFVLTANKGMMLDKFTVNGVAKTPTATLKEGVNTYSQPLAAMTGKAEVVITWKEKPSVVVTVTGTEQVVNADKAATVTVTTDVQGLLPAVAYYKEAACTNLASDDDRKKAGTYYVKITAAETTTHKAVNMVVSLIISNKKVPTVETVTCATTLLQGQPLSAATLTGGKATIGTREIKGTWSWANPNQAVKAGAATGNKYAAIFTPDSASMYAGATAQVGIAVNMVTTVTVKQTEGGIVSIDAATVDNKYVGTATDPKKLTATATPKAGYTFEKWINPVEVTTEAASKLKAGVPAAEGDPAKQENISAKDGLVISAQFAKITRAITITSPSSNGTLTVLNGATEVKTGDKVALGTTLAIVATPAEGYQVKTVGYTLTNGELVPATSFVVGGTSEQGYTVSAEFEAIPVEKHMINVATVHNGSIVMKMAGTETVVNPNSAVEEGTSVSVIALPNRGYKLASLKANATSLTSGGSFTVLEDINLAVAFEKESYPVTVANVAGATFSVATKNMLFGDKLAGITASTSDAKNYKVVSLLVNNLPVENGSAITVEGPTTISAQVQKLIPVEILNGTETTKVLYNGKSQEYAVRTAAGLGGFKVMYKKGSEAATETAPSDAGTYALTITRPFDGMYAEFTATRTMEIEKAVPGILSIPLANDISNGVVEGSSTVPGIWSTSPTRPEPNSASSTKSLRAAGDLVTIYFHPDDPNVAVVKATTPKDQPTAAALTKTITMPASTAGGTLVLMNGGIAVTDGKSYQGQTFTIEAIPDAGYKVESIKVGGVETTSFTLGDNNVTVTATFTAKSTITAPTGKTVAKPYTGSAISVTPAELGLTTAGWVVSYKQSSASATPVTVGSYDVYLSRAEDATNQAVAETKAGTLTIEKAASSAMTVTLPTASSVMKGDALSTSTLTGDEVKLNGAVVPGTFTWKAPTTTVDEAKEYDVTFTPTDVTSYSTIEGKVHVSLKDVPSYQMTLAVGSGGSVEITDATGAKVAGGAMIPAGMQLTIKALSGTIAGITPAGEGVTVKSTTVDGVTTWMCTTANTNFSLAISFTGGSTPEPPVVPGEDETPVTGITLNATTKTLAIGAEFTLKATIAPADATIKTVNWTSSNPAVATVDAAGKVKALKAGTASIIATTTSGGHTAICNVTVSSPTGVDEILAATRVYAQNGSICINPERAVKVIVFSMEGRMVYAGEVTELFRLPASSGVYFVRLNDGKNEATVRVLVR